jgi:hypothetical protein
LTQYYIQITEVAEHITMLKTCSCVPTNTTHLLSRKIGTRISDSEPRTSEKNKPEKMQEHVQLFCFLKNIKYYAEKKLADYLNIIHCSVSTTVTSTCFSIFRSSTVIIWLPFQKTSLQARMKERYI